MHPAYSVILFTTASGAGYGLLALLGLVGLMHGPAASSAFGFTAILVALGLIVTGLLASTFHLGHPERAWRALSQWRSSWLSREGVIALATFGPALLFAAAWLGLVALPISALGLVTAIFCTLTVFCTAKIYSTLKTIRAWHHPLVAPVYLVMALATGACLLAAIAAPFGRFQPAQAVIACAALLAAAALKRLYWRAIDAAPKPLTAGHATGLGGRVRQWELPHTSTNYIQTEMGYSVARRHAAKLRMIVLVLFLATFFCMALSAFITPWLSLAAAPLALAAALVERWLFFAEAQHVVTLYYGAEAA